MTNNIIQLEKTKVQEKDAPHSSELDVYANQQSSSDIKPLEMTKKNVIKRIKLTTLDRSQSLTYEIYSDENLEEVLWDDWGDEMFELELYEHSIYSIQTNLNVKIKT